MIRRALHAFASALALFAVCAAAEELRFIDNDDDRGLIVDPETPRWPRNLREPGYVDIAGSLTPMGRLHDETVTADRPENEPYADAVRAVLPKWRFRTLQDRQCAPRTAPIHVRVYFDESRHVRITHEAEPPSPETSMRSIERTDPVFPREMLRDGISGRVYARAEVAPDGHVARVLVRAFSNHADLKGDALLPFEVSATRALKQWKFAPAPEGLDRVRVACWTIDFNVFK